MNNLGGVNITLENLFDNYKEFEEIMQGKKDDVIDLENLKCNPTTVLPLLCECKNKNLKLETGDSAFDYLVSLLQKNKLFSILPKSRMENDEIDFITNYMDNLNSEYCGYYALRNIIAEIVNNVYDHSRSDSEDIQSYILSNRENIHKKLDIAVVDDGISIPGLFEKLAVDFDNDCHAIEKAIGVFSTISDSEFERGNGLWTIIRLVAEGNGGEILLISRAGCLHICGEDYKYYLFKDKHIFKGTLVCVRLNKYEIQNIYELIDFIKPGRYKLGVIHDY